MAVTPLASNDPREVGGYRLSGRLGAGGMGVVFLGAAADGSPVAVKVMRPELGGDAEFRTRFRREAEAARRVSGQFTAQVLAADPDADQPWLVTAYVAGPSLAEAVASYGPLPARSVLSLLAGVAQALGAIHAAGLVHRDLKPSNVLLADDGPRVIDFGIVRTVGATSVTATGKIAGSLQYMAPEQARGDGVGPAADVWALGATGCYAATGRSPFGDGTEAALLYRVLQADPNLAGCPPEVAGIIMACLSRDPAARPPAGRIADWCTAGLAGRQPDGWLPPAIAADVTRHAVPAAPPMLAGGLAAAGMPLPVQSGPVPPGPVPAGYGPPGPVPAGPLPPGYGPPGPTLSVPSIIGAGGTIPARPPLPGPAAAPVSPPPGGSTWPAAQPRRRSSAGLIAGGAAAAVVLILVVVLAVVFSNGGAASTRAADPSPASTSPASTSPATPRSAIDPCLVGHWTSTSVTEPGFVDKQPVTFTGTKGWTLDIQGNGHAVERWDNFQQTGQLNGVSLQEYLNGTATYTLSTHNSQLSFSHPSASGTVRLVADNKQQGSGALDINAETGNYICGSGYLQEIQGNDSSQFQQAPT